MFCGILRFLVTAAAVPVCAQLMDGVRAVDMSNAIVLDPFGGSGSTLITCEQTDRVCRTIELDEKFCDVIVKRYIEQVGSSVGVTVVRDGLTYSYEEIASA